MRDFLIVLPFAYLTDVVALWAAAILFNAWYRSHDTPITDYLFQTLGACAVAFVVRALQQRSASFFRQSLARGRLLVNLIVATFAGFLATFAYNEVIELTGSPSPSKLFYVGRPLSMIAICFVLVATYCITKIIAQSAETIEVVAQGALAKAARERHAIRHAAGEEPHEHHHQPKNDRIYLELAAIQSLVCVIDLVVHQNGWLTLWMFGILAAVLLVFVAFNVCWSRKLRSKEYYYAQTGASESTGTLSSSSSFSDSLKEM